MSKGYVYIMTSSINGLIKIGKSKDWNRRCQLELESNGYKNANGLKTYFVVEVDDQEEIEGTMHDIFRESRVSNFELFAVDKDRAKRVLSKMGIQVYPEINTTLSKSKPITKYSPFWNQLSKYANDVVTNTDISKFNQQFLKVGLKYSDAWIGICFNSYESFNLLLDFCSFNIELFDKLKNKKSEIETELGFSLNWTYRIAKNHLRYATAYFKYDFNKTDISDNIDVSLLKDIANKVTIMQQVFAKYVAEEIK